MQVLPGHKQFEAQLWFYGNSSKERKSARTLRDLSHFIYIQINMNH